MGRAPSASAAAAPLRACLLAAAVAVLLAQTSLGGVAATYEGAARVWRLVLSRGCGVGAAWASLEAFGAYCLLRKADQNKKRFANQLKDC